MHQLLCCSLPDYTYSHCNTYSSDWGVGIDCRDHGDETLMGENVEYVVLSHDDVRGRMQLWRESRLSRVSQPGHLL